MNGWATGGPQAGRGKRTRWVRHRSFERTCGDEASGFLRADAVSRLDRVADRRLLNVGGRYLPR